MATVNGTANNDDLFIASGVTGDTLLGLAGNDTLDAGFAAGGNTLKGGEGNDKLFANLNDQLFGDEGNDELSATDGNGNNKLFGGEGNDTIFASFNDIVFGDAGDDVIFGGLGANTLTGGSGKDVFWIANVDVPDNANAIADFNPISDTIRINLAGVTQLSDLRFEQVGNDSTISFNGKKIATINETLISNLNSSNIVLVNSAANNSTTNLAPTIKPASFKIDENLKSGSLIGKLVGTDPNVGDRLRYTITSGNDDVNGNGKSAFVIDSKTGEIKINDSGDLDFEKNPIFNLKAIVSDDVNSSSEVAVKVNLNNLVEPSLTSYEFTNLPKLGTTSKGQDIFLGGFSGLSFQGTNFNNGNLKFITLTDRGPNGDPTGQNRPFYLPDFQPEVVSFELNRTTNKILITNRTGLFRADGTTKITGLPNLQAGVSGTAYTDEIGVNLDNQVLPNDKFGIDSEGIVIDVNGNYWIVDEYRPAIYQFDVNGKLINRFIPKGTAAASTPDAPRGSFGTEVLPEVYAQRRSNRGFEAVALEGNKLYAFMQSAIDNPDTTGDKTSRASRNLRILEFDIISKTVTGEYLYLLDDISGTGNAKTDKIGDAVSLGNKKFAVVERDDLSTTSSNKLIYQIDLAKATNINKLSVTFPVGKTTIEQLTEDELTAAKIAPVSKNLIANAATAGYTGVEKLEGLALVAPNTLALINDNDFNVSGTNVPEKLGILELPNILTIPLQLDKNDLDTFSLSGGSNNKPTLSFSVVSNAANKVSELGIFNVDDAAGRIDGLSLGQTGYVEKALARSRVIFSALSNNPNGYTANGSNRLLDFNNNDRVRFYEINDKTTTTDLVLKTKSFNKVTFSSTSTLNFKEISNSESSINFNNLDIKVKATNEDLLLGTGLQDRREGEVIDLRDSTSKVKADFTLNREAAFDNFIGFYKVENEKGDIKKADGTIVSVGQSGYTKAAVGSQISGIDLSVANQSTKTSSATLTAGSIFAPFIIINGRPDKVLDADSSNDPRVYFSYLGANSDGIDHVRLLGNNTFGFEDVLKGGDFDYNDFIVKVKLTPIV